MPKILSEILSLLKTIFDNVKKV